MATIRKLINMISSCINIYSILLLFPKSIAFLDEYLLVQSTIHLGWTSGAALQKSMTFHCLMRMQRVHEKISWILKYKKPHPSTMLLELRCWNSRKIEIKLLWKCWLKWESIPHNAMVRQREYSQKRVIQGWPSGIWHL